MSPQKHFDQGIPPPPPIGPLLLGGGRVQKRGDVPPRDHDCFPIRIVKCPAHFALLECVSLVDCDVDLAGGAVGVSPARRVHVHASCGAPPAGENSVGRRMYPSVGPFYYVAPAAVPCLHGDGPHGVAPAVG